MNDTVKNLFLWLVIIVVLVTVFSNFGAHQRQERSVPYSEFVTMLDKGNITKATIENRVIHAKTTDKQAISTYIPMEDPFLLPDLIKQKRIPLAYDPEFYIYKYIDLSLKN